ncbi:Trp biosynthesis-associated membrane protein [Actinoplanes sp. CA-142083]|uniref:Trp biosynthesis-associated membrane protein n=1 Tax=Actinoplanes sp. CA-142083 TaxID=3239903 RepID=UPI003D9281FE
MNRRSYLLTLVACLAGAALSLYAITRTWSLHLTPRPGMTAVREARTGTDLEPWVTGLALVALAGTGALLATSGWLRRVVGALLALAGVGIVIGAIAGRAGLDPGSAGAGATAWPILCALGGLIITAGGLTAARLGHRWPRMSARYDRKPPAPRTTPLAGGAAAPLAGPAGTPLAGSAATSLAGPAGTSAAGPATTPGAGPASGSTPGAGPASGSTPGAGPASGSTPGAGPASGSTPGAGPASGSTPGAGPASGSTPGAGSASMPVAGSTSSSAASAASAAIDNRSAWDALDRGDDPTVS